MVSTHPTGTTGQVGSSKERYFSRGPRSSSLKPTPLWNSRIPSRRLLPKSIGAGRLRHGNALAKLLDGRVRHDAGNLGHVFASGVQDGDYLVIDAIFLDGSAAVDKYDVRAVFC